MQRPLKGLVVGLANDQSIAWGCVQAFNAMGAELAITYQNEKTKKYIEPLVKQVNAPIFELFDVTNPEQEEALFKKIEAEWGELDFVLHSLAFAPKEDLHGRVVDCSADGFKMAMDISCHSLIRLSKRAEPLMKNGGSILTMSYYGAEKVVKNYNMMGPVKAALESSARALAVELGEKGIRVNVVSPGPVLTRAASGLSHFDALMEKAIEITPSHQLVTTEQIGGTAAFLVSDKSKNITGQIIFVDNGYNIVA